VSTLGFVLANLRRNRLRSALTAAAVALAVLLVCLLLTMPAGLDAILERVASDARISVHNKAGIVYAMPYAFTRRVRQVPGVADAVAMAWFGGAFEEDRKITFPSFAVEVDHVGGVYPDYRIPAEQLADFRRYRDGAIVGRGTMHKYRWKVGDRVTLRSTVWPVALDFRIVGEIPDDRSPLFWMNREYLDQALKAQGHGGLGIVGLIWVRAADPARVNAIMATIDDLSRNSDAETASETEKSFFSSFFGSLQGIITIILIVTGLVCVSIVFIAANTASMAIRERSAEIAVLKAIGFGRRTIFAMLLTEAGLLATTAGLAGVAAAIGVTRVLRMFSGWTPAFGPLGNFVVTPPVILQGVLLSLAVGVFSGLVPAWGAARKPIVETLHEVF
jgi:putative ABC transport system permease protein